MTGRAPSCLLELAERCEQATGPDRELDADIWKLQPNYGSAISRASGLWPKVCDRAAYERATAQRLSPSYTASLDAAMTLVPERQHFGCGSKDATGTAWAWVGQFNGPEEIANAATPALALCAAALRARASNPTPPSDGEL